MGSTGPGGDGIEFSIAPEQRVRDVVADQWAETISSLNKSGRGDLAEDLVGLGFAPKTKGGFDVGDISNLAPLSTPSFQPNLSEPISAQQSPTAGASPLQLSPEHLTLRPETPSHQQDHGFQVPQDFNRGAFRYDPVATARDRIQRLGEMQPVIEEGMDHPKGGFDSSGLQRIGTEFGVKPEVNAIGESGGGAASGGEAASKGLFSGGVGSLAAGVFMAEHASGLMQSIIDNPFSKVADTLMNPGQARHGSIKQVIDAAQTEGLDNFTIAGRSRDFFRQGPGAIAGGLGRTGGFGIAGAIAGWLFPPSQDHH